MSDQIVQGTEGETPEAQAEEQPTTSPAFLTVEQAKELFEGYKKSMEDAVMQRQVNLYTQGTEKLRKRLTDLEKTVKIFRDSGVAINESDLNVARNKIITNSFMEEDLPEQPVVQQPQQQQQLKQPEVEHNLRNVEAMVTNFGKSIVDSFGVTFSENDPELEMIKRNGSPEEYLISLVKASMAWTQRNAEQPNPEARIPGMVTGTAPDNDWQKAYKKDIEAAYKNPNSKNLILQIRKKYRDQGYPI